MIYAAIAIGCVLVSCFAAAACAIATCRFK